MGKVACSVLFAWGVALAASLLSLVIVNVAHWTGRLVLFAPIVVLGDIILTFLVAALSAGVGALISMRSETVQQAVQALTAILLLPPMVLTMGLLVLGEMWKGRLNLGAIDGGQLLIILTALLVVVNVAVFSAGMLRFKRARLILARGAR